MLHVFGHALEQSFGSRGKVRLIATMDFQNQIYKYALLFHQLLAVNKSFHFSVISLQEFCPDAMRNEYPPSN